MLTSLLLVYLFELSDFWVDVYPLSSAATDGHHHRRKLAWLNSPHPHRIACTLARSRNEIHTDFTEETEGIYKLGVSTGDFYEILGPSVNGTKTTYPSTLTTHAYHLVERASLLETKESSSQKERNSRRCFAHSRTLLTTLSVSFCSCLVLGGLWANSRGFYSQGD